MTTTEQIKKLNEKSFEFQLWYYILKNSPTKEWKRPLSTFIRTLLKTRKRISPKDIKHCVYFMHNLAIYIYAKSLDNKSIKGSIKNEMEKATTLVKQGKIYRPDIIITKQFEQKLNGDIPENLRWGLCAIVEWTLFFDETIDRAIKAKQKDIIKNAVVEQLIPNNWKPAPKEQTFYLEPKYKWSRQKIKKAINSIGGFFLIEKSIHKNTCKITEHNFFCLRKNITNGYKNSIFGEVIFLCIEYTDLCKTEPLQYHAYKSRQKRIIERLVQFFKGRYEVCIP